MREPLIRKSYLKVTWNSLFLTVLIPHVSCVSDCTTALPLERELLLQRVIRGAKLCVSSKMMPVMERSFHSNQSRTSLKRREGTYFCSFERTRQDIYIQHKSLIFLSKPFKCQFSVRSLGICPIWQCRQPTLLIRPENFTLDSYWTPLFRSFA